MRGDRDEQLWALTPLTPDSFVPQDHRFRALRQLADRALAKLSPTFTAMYASIGQPSIAPERLIKAMLLMALTQATGRAEREAAPRMLDRQPRRRRRITLGADKGYDSREFVQELRQRQVTPHVAQNQSRRRSAVDGRTTNWGGYQRSQRVRKRVEEIFGWVKTVAGGHKLRFIGLARNRLWTEMTAAAYNLVRIVRLKAVQQDA